MSKEYEDMSYIELAEELKVQNKGQRQAHSDWGWWGWQGSIDKIDEVNLKMMKTTISLLCERYGLSSVETYISKLKSARIKRLEAQKAEEQL